MNAVELSRLAIAAAETDDDLRAMIFVRKQVTPEARPTVENLRHNLDLVEALRKVAEGKGVSVAQAAIAWVLAQGPRHDTAIVP